MPQIIHSDRQPDGRKAEGGEIKLRVVKEISTDHYILPIERLSEIYGGSDDA